MKVVVVVMVVEGPGGIVVVLEIGLGPEATFFKGLVSDSKAI